MPIKTGAKRCPARWTALRRWRGIYGKAFWPSTPCREFFAIGCDKGFFRICRPGVAPPFPLIPDKHGGAAFKTQGADILKDWSPAASRALDIGAHRFRFTLDA